MHTHAHHVSNQGMEGVESIEEEKDRQIAQHGLTCRGVDSEARAHRGSEVSEILGSFSAAENARSMTPFSAQFRRVLRGYISGSGVE